MRKDKRGMALITAIAVLALMLILFGGLAMIYSSQVSRNKLEHEQSQAMLLAQSYTEMLNHVLESPSNSDVAFKEALGEIASGKEIEIKSRLDFSDSSDQVEIIAIADRKTTNGNTTTRPIKIKITATVNGETRSIISDYTYQVVTGGGVPDYAVYGNKINFYRNGQTEKDGEEIKFKNDWYQDENRNNEYNSLIDMNDKKAFKFGGIDKGNSDQLFRITKDRVINPELSDPPIEEDYAKFAQTINNNGEGTLVLPLWKTFSSPDSMTPNCSKILKGYDNTITESCIWDEQMDSNKIYDVRFYAADEDIIVYLPINGELTIKIPRIYFDKERLVDENGEVTVRQLYFYAYHVDSDRPAKLTIDGRVTIANSEIQGMSKCLDIFFISNDEIELYLPELKATYGYEYNQLEAYFYLPKGTVIWDAVPDLSTGNVYKNRIRGCLIADEIKVSENKTDSHKGIVGIDYIPPRELDSGASNEKTISFKLNSYEEGGKS